MFLRVLCPYFENDFNLIIKHLKKIDNKKLQFLKIITQKRFVCM